MTHGCALALIAPAAARMAWTASALVAALVATVPALGGGWTSEPLADKWAKAFADTPVDPLPKELSANAHFAISDERRHDLFAKEIANRGGAMLGVGPEQNYLMAGWAKPELLILMDFDQFVVDLHRIYRLVFLEAASPAEFKNIWRGKGGVTLQSLIERAYANDADKRDKLLKVAKRSQNLVVGKMRAMEKYGSQFHFESYVTDQGIYDGIRALFQQNRVVAVRGDLTGTATIAALAKTLHEMKMPLRTLYLSNAEKYFPWVDSYRENMRALPFDDRTVVIRTAGWANESAAEEDPLYMYVVQTGANFRAWLGSGIKNWSPMLSRRGPKLAQGFYRIEAEPGAKKVKK